QELRDLLAVTLDGDLTPVPPWHLREVVLRELDALVQQGLAAVVDELPCRFLADQDLLHLAVVRVAQDADLFVTGPLEASAFLVLDGLGALVLVRALAGEDARVDHDAGHSRRHLQRAVPDVAGLVAEDRRSEGTRL